MRNIRRASALCTHKDCWINVELVKDCGLIPYLLHHDHGVETEMVGGCPPELHDLFDDPEKREVRYDRTLSAEEKEKIREVYPYLSLVKGMEMVFLRNASKEVLEDYMRRHAKEIDLLIVRGIYSKNFGIVEIYKEENPRGYVYCGMDCNSGWIDRVFWYKNDFSSFMERIDYRAVSCTAMQRFLSLKWPWEIRTVVNGSYSFSQQESSDQTERENVILSVGRISSHQKNIRMLIEAFLPIADRIPDWRVRLVGEAENDFFSAFEGISGADRIEWVGPIRDREALMEEYRRAKIFALPSMFEGGTPNAAADAVAAGCVMLVTDVDAWEDMTAGEKCGWMSPRGDTWTYAANLHELCLHADLETMSLEAVRWGKEFYDMRKIVKELYGSICFGE